MNVPKCLCVFLCVVVSVNAQCADNTTMLAAALKGKVAHPSCSTFTKYCSYSSIGNACKRSCGHCGGSSGGKGSSSGGKGGSSSSGSCKDNNAALKSALGGKMGGNPSCSMVKLYCTQKGIGSKLAAICPKTCGHCGGSASTGTGTVSSSSKPMNCSFPASCSISGITALLRSNPCDTSCGEWAATHLPCLAQKVKQLGAGGWMNTASTMAMKALQTAATQCNTMMAGAMQAAGAMQKHPCSVTRLASSPCPKTQMTSTLSSACCAWMTNFMGTCGKSNEVKNNPQLLAVMNQASGICHNSKHTSANHTAAGMGGKGSHN